MDELIRAKGAITMCGALILTGLLLFAGVTVGQTAPDACPAGSTRVETSYGFFCKGADRPAPPSLTPTSAITVKIGDHVLGETVEQYRQAEHISGRCELLNNDSKLAAKILKWQQAEKKNRHQNMQNPDPTPYQYELCQQLKQAENGVAETYSSPMFEVSFVGGRLARFRKLFDASATESFTQILADLMAKYGAPDLKATETFQNSYGAQFPVGRAHWTLPDKTTISAVEKVEYINSVGYVRSTLVTIAQPDAPSVEEPHKNPF